MIIRALRSVTTLQNDSPSYIRRPDSRETPQHGPLGPARQPCSEVHRFMKKWLFILPVLAVTGYVVFSNFSDKPAFWSAGAVAGARKPAAPTTAIVALRDINFAITAAGDV